MTDRGKPWVGGLDDPRALVDNADESDDDPPPGVPSLKDIANLTEDDDAIKPTSFLAPWMEQSGEASSWRPSFASSQNHHNPKRSREGSFQASPALIPMTSPSAHLGTKSSTSKVSTVSEAKSSVLKSKTQAIKQFCVYCGAKVDPQFLTAKFCGYCGSKRDLDDRDLDVLAPEQRAPVSTEGASTDGKADWWCYDGHSDGKEMDNDTAQRVRTFQDSWLPRQDAIMPQLWSYSDRSTDAWQGSYVDYAMYNGCSSWHELYDAQMTGTWGILSTPGTSSLTPSFGAAC